MLCVIKGYCLFVIIHCLSVHVHVCNYLFGFILGFFFGTWLRNIENNWIHVCNCTWHTPLYPLEKKCKNICLSCWNLKCLLSNLHMKYMCIAFCTPWAFKGWFHEFWSLEFFLFSLPHISVQCTPTIQGQYQNYWYYNTCISTCSLVQNCGSSLFTLR